MGVDLGGTLGRRGTDLGELLVVVVVAVAGVLCAAVLAFGPWLGDAATAHPSVVQFDPPRMTGSGG
jgi:hypothetical protein